MRSLHGRKGMIFCFWEFEFNYERMEKLFSKNFEREIKFSSNKNEEISG